MKKNKKQKVILLTLDTLMVVLEKSVGTKMFQTIYAKVDGKKKDITENGELSCAFYVSSILAIFGLTDQAHATVSGTIKDLEARGWVKTKKLKKGSVIVWDKPQDGSFLNQHIGFYLGDEKAISNRSAKKVPAIHHFTFGKIGSKGYREIVAIYQHSQLNK